MADEVRKRETVRVVVPKERIARLKRWLSVLLPVSGGIVGGAMGAELGRAMSGFRPNYSRIAGGGAGGLALGALGGHLVSRFGGDLLDAFGSGDGAPVFTSDAVYSKTAETRGTSADRDMHMSRQAAYVAGFCKAAEAAGVDPAALCKAAGLANMLGSVVGGGMHLAGGILRGTGNAIGGASQFVFGKGGDIVGGIMDAGARNAKRYFNLLGGGSLGKYKKLQRRLSEMRDKAVSGGLSDPSGDYLNARNYDRAVKGLGRLAQRARAEQAAVDTTRGLTYLGLGSGGLLYGAHKLHDMSSEE